METSKFTHAVHITNPVANENYVSCKTAKVV